MSTKKVREITIREDHGAFSLIGRKSFLKEDYDFSGLEALRKLLSKERARMLDVIKNKEPTSIYDLSKKLNRDFRSVFSDIKLLERFGLIEMIEEKKNGRICHKPILISDTLTIHLKI